MANEQNQPNTNVSIGDKEFSIKDIETALGSDFSIVNKSKLDTELANIKNEGIQIGKTQYQIDAEAKIQERNNKYRQAAEQREAFYKSKGFDKKLKSDKTLETVNEMTDRIILEFLGKSQEGEAVKANVKNEFEDKYNASIAQSKDLLSKIAELEGSLNESKDNNRKAKNSDLFNKYWSANIEPKINGLHKGMSTTTLVKEAAKASFLSQFDSIQEHDINGTKQYMYIKDGINNLTFNPEKFLSTLGYVNEITKKEAEKVGFSNTVNPQDIDSKGKRVYQILTNPKTVNEVIDYGISQGLVVGSKEMNEYKQKYANFNTLPVV